VQKIARALFLRNPGFPPFRCANTPNILWLEGAIRISAQIGFEFEEFFLHCLDSVTLLG
jgi:hypothetical protein